VFRGKVVGEEDLFIYIYIYIYIYKFFWVFWRCGMGSLLCQYYDVEQVAMIYKKI